MKQRQLTLTRVLSAPIEKVWDAWTNPDSIKKWKSPEGMVTPEVSVDFRVGGTYRIVMQGTDLSDERHKGTFIVGGTYLEIQKPQKLVYTWLWEGAPAETHTTTVTIYLKALDAQTTELTLTHAGFPDEPMEQEHTKGWNSTFVKLEKYLG